LSSYEEARRALGVQLRQLREHAQLTSRTLAQQIGVSQSKVSKIETGRLTPTAEDVRAWLRATDSPASIGDQLLTQLRTVQVEYQSWRAQLQSGHAREQRAILDLEAKTSLMRIFQPVLVPGLLQTADYARVRFAANAQLHGTPPDTDAAVAVRMQRQQVLYDQSKRFEILVTEGALRHRVVPPDVMPAQLDRLITATTLPNVELGMLPFEAELLPAAPLSAFVMFDSELVTVELLTAPLYLRGPDDIAFYGQVFDQLRAVARFGDEARAVLRRLALELASWAGA
jgi:transcriptional regulator with XRE-family HTH domain